MLNHIMSSRAYLALPHYLLPHFLSAVSPGCRAHTGHLQDQKQQNQGAPDVHRGGQTSVEELNESVNPDS